MDATLSSSEREMGSAMGSDEPEPAPPYPPNCGCGCHHYPYKVKRPECYCCAAGHSAEPAPREEPDPPVTEMRVCEIASLILHPGQLYRFTVDLTCGKCRAYFGGLSESEESR